MSTDDVTTTPTPQPAADEVLAPDVQLEALRDQVAQLESRLAERTEDLQRLQAEYINFKRRVDRDRDLARRAGKEQILTDLLPALDVIQLADQHGELDGPFKMLADQISAVAARHGLSSYGQVGDQFDPTLHEALMQLPMSGATKTCISQVMQPGHRIHDKVLRPARVAVSEPDTQQAATESSTHGDEE